MIVEGIADLIFNIVQGMLSMLPDIKWDVDNSVFSIFFDVLEMVCYLLPMPTVLTILSFVIMINMFKIVISIIKTIWDLLPFV